jgi:hypothetical protein
MGAGVSNQPTSGQLSNILGGVNGNLVFSAVCGLCAALGVVKGNDISNAQNWPLWIVLLVTGVAAAGAVGGGANAARLWWRRRRIDRASGERLTIILADLVGNDPNASQKQNVSDSLVHFLGPCIDVLSYPRSFAIGDGNRDAEVRKTHRRVQKVLADKRGDVLIWGRVDPSGALALYFWGRSTDAAEGASFRSIGDGERPLDLPAHFDRDLGAAIAGRVVAVGDALVEKTGSFLSPYAEHFADQIAPLVAHPKGNWTPDARGSVLFAFGLANALLGREKADGACLETAVAAYRAALEEWTRERVPLQWAMTQNNLGAALWTLGERESGTARLEEAVAAFRAALEERTRERVPLDWAMTQNNLGSALARLGERECGTARLEEAVGAYRAALE